MQLQAGKEREKQGQGSGKGGRLVHGGLSRTCAPSFKGGVSFSAGKYELTDEEKRDQELTRRDRVDYRHWLQRHAQRLMYFAGVDGSLRGCLQGTFERWNKREKCLVNRAEVHSYGGKLHWVGLAHCKSPLCPVCGPILAGKRMEEARQASEYLLKAGFSYLFPTFTASHGPKARLVDVRRNFSKAFTHFYNSAGYKQARRKFGWRFSFLAYEVTDDDPASGSRKRSGWHLHRHGVLWLERAWLTEEETEEVRRLLLAGWKWALAKVGMTCSDDRGVYMESVQQFLKKRGLQKPFDQLSEEKQKKILDNACCYIAKSLGYEMTGTGRKKGKINKYGGSRISHWRLLELAITGHKRARERWLELYESCQEKRLSTFRMSQGLRAFCHMEKEKTDEELMSETETATPVLIFGTHWDFAGKKHEEFAWDEWQAIARQGRLSAFCSILEDSESDQVSLAGALIGAAKCGYDIKSDEWLDSSGLSQVWVGKTDKMGKRFCLVAQDKPWPAAAKRLKEEEKAEKTAQKQAAEAAWLSQLDAYSADLVALGERLVTQVMERPELYAAGRVTKEKKAAWSEILRYGWWDFMCWNLRDLGYMPPPARPDEPVPEQCSLVA